jgi:hypothetical protein
MVNLIGQRIQRAASIEDTLQVAIRELGTAIGATRVRADIRSATSVVAPTEPVVSTKPAIAIVEGEKSAFDAEPTSAD